MNYYLKTNIEFIHDFLRLWLCHPTNIIIKDLSTILSKTASFWQFMAPETNENHFGNLWLLKDLFLGAKAPLQIASVSKSVCKSVSESAKSLEKAVYQ